MPVTQDRLSRLREFGLSEYAARSYLALLDLGIAEARDVSSISKVPQAKIYHVLEQLHEKGLVVILPEFPKKYAPVPFEEYLGRLFDEHTKAARSIDEQRPELAEMFRVMGDTEVGDRGFFTVIKGRRNVLAKIEEIIGQTQRDLVVLATSGTASRAQHMLGELRRARERNVRVRILAPVHADTIEKLSTIAATSELRARDLGDEEQSGKVAIVVSDSVRAFLIHFVPDDGNLYSGKDIGVYTDQEAMVAAIQAIVEPHWARSATYDEKKDEILHGRTPEFTRVYATREEAEQAFSQVLRAGAAELLVVNGLTGASASPGPIFTGHGHAGARRSRALLDLRDADDIAAWSKAVAGDPALEVRHARIPALTRQVVVDEREAFYAIGTGEQQGDVVVHTSSRAAIRAMRDHFEREWAKATSLQERAREVAVFPGLLPDDVGMGRLFRLLRDAVVVIDARGNVALWNPAAASTFMRDLAQAHGLPARELVEPSAREAFDARLERARQGAEGSDHFETVGLRPSGPFSAEATLSKMRTPDNETLVIAVMRDITARKNAQQAHERATRLLLATLDATPDGILVVSQDGAIRGHNRGFREMWGIPDEVAEGGGDEDLLSFVRDQLEDPDAFPRKARDLHDGTEAESHDVLRSKDGRTYERSSRPQRLDGEVVGRVWTFRETTSQPVQARPPRAH